MRNLWVTFPAGNILQIKLLEWKSISSTPLERQQGEPHFALKLVTFRAWELLQLIMQIISPVCVNLWTCNKSLLVLVHLTGSIVIY